MQHTASDSLRPLRLRFLLGASAAMLVSLCACTMEPHYRRPDAPISRQWPDPPASNNAPATNESAANVTAAAADIGWREFFADARLQRLIEVALQHNPDARVAALNIQAARDQYRIQRSNLLPKIDAMGVERVQKYPANVAGQVAGAGAAAAGSGGSTSRYFDAGVGFTAWEIDLFGRLRSLDHASLEQYRSYVETRRNVRISLVAAVADAYLTWLADQELLRITQDTLASQENSYNLTKLSFEGGVATAPDLRQAQTLVETARANIEQYTRQIALDRNALALLLGSPLPTDLPGGPVFDEQTLLTELPEGLPSDLLVRRPDILAAEHQLRAANANIGAARAAFFPSISLTGQYGTASTKLSGLFDHGSQAWTFSPQINLPLFAAGANVAALDAAKVQKNIYVVEYERAIQTAFREVADALAGRGTLDRQIAADQALVEATGESYRLSDMRFRQGVAAYLNVLDSQRALYSAQQSLVSVKLARMLNLVALYRALGGGWQAGTSG